MAAFLPQISAAVGGFPSNSRHGQQRRRTRRESSMLVPLREDGGESSAARPEDQPYFFSDQIDRSDGALRYFATCAPGLEEIVAAELRAPSIGAHSVKTGSSGVYFAGSWHTGFLANLWSRCAVRILQLVAAADLPPSPPSGLGDDGGGGQSGEAPYVLRTQPGVGLYGRDQHDEDAICDALRSCCGGRKPDPPESHGAADLPLFLSLYRDKALLYRDMSGTSLHMRGYRDAMHKASLNEAIAAGVLTMAGWNDKFVPGFGSMNKNAGGDRVLLDPMCGSGTFLIEAAMMDTNLAPGLLRERWPFMRWHDYDKVEWRRCCKQAAEAQIEASAGLRLMGNDVHEGSILLCARDARRAGVENLLELSCEDCR